MFDDALLKTDFAGKDGFTWWFGRIANPDVWKDINSVTSQEGSYGQRAKVRIVGYHPFTDELAEEDLPWANCMMDAITGNGQGGMGDVSTLQGGETCIGCFLDGEDGQQPFILGLINRHSGTKNSISASEAKSSKTSAFKNQDNEPQQELPTKRNPLIDNTSVIKPANFSLEAAQAAQKGGLITGLEGSEGGGGVVGRIDIGVVTPFAQASDAAKIAERNGTSTHINPSNCKNDAIGQITQALTDFITLTNSLESSLGKFVDPIENLIYDMDAEIRRIVRQVKGLIKGILNNVRDGIFGKLNQLFAQFLGTLNLVNPFEFLTDEASRKAHQGIMDLIFCIFEKLLGDLTGFLTNMFSSLIEDVVSGPICAAEQFVSGIFAKVFEQLENLMEPVLSGLDWLTGGIGTISEFIGKASNLASQILSFIGCDGRKCTTPSKWASTLSGSIEGAADDWGKQVSNINLLKGVSSDLTQISDEAAQGIGGFFGTDEFKQRDYNGMRLEGVLRATDKLTGGNSAGALNGALGSIESAISTSSFFGTNSIFDSCNQRVNNPTRQRDLMPMPPGFVFDKCITPEIEITGKGSGATATPIVSEFGKIIATQITSRGSGYDSNTTASIIDNTNNGRAAELKVLVNANGEISQIVVVRSGFGYCPNVSPIVPNPVGIITAIYVDKPGIGYTISDSILIPLPRIGEDTINPDVPDRPLVTIDPVILDPIEPGGTQPVKGGDGYIVAPIPTEGNGSIIDVRIPFNMDAEYNFIPKPIINSKNGRGASLIPILTYKQLDNFDTTNRSGLVGITSVIDCVGEDPVPQSNARDLTPTAPATATQVSVPEETGDVAPVTSPVVNTPTSTSTPSTTTSTPSTTSTTSTTSSDTSSSSSSGSSSSGSSSISNTTYGSGY